MQYNFIDLSGQKFGRLSVQNLHGSTKGRVRRDCVCDCGKKTIVLSDNLKQGTTKSCGCLRAEITSQRRAASKKEWTYSKTRIYNIWKGIKARCYNPKNTAFKRYGEKGITVCDEWLNSSKAFYEWAIQNGYQDNLSIERKNSKGNYEPGNCKWADAYEQNNNVSKNKPLTFRGKTMNLCQWARELGMNKNTLNKRLRSGWTIEEAFTKPICVECSRIRKKKIS